MPCASAICMLGKFHQHVPTSSEEMNSQGRPPLHIWSPHFFALLPEKNTNIYRGFPPCMYLQAGKSSAEEFPQVYLQAGSREPLWQGVLKKALGSMRGQVGMECRPASWTQGVGEARVQLLLRIWPCAPPARVQQPRVH